MKLKHAIGQFRWVFLETEEIDFVEVEEFDDKTYRDAKGFGSTGLKPTAI